MRKIIFDGAAFKDFIEWLTIDKKIHQRIVHLIMDTLRQPFKSLGKAEPLKYELTGY